MNTRLGVIAIVVAAVAAAAGLFASPSNSAAYCRRLCGVTLDASSSGKSYAERMDATGTMYFNNTDSVPHTVVFADGLCSITLPPGQKGGPGWPLTYGVPNPGCTKDITYFVGSYPYTVDGNWFAGTVTTTPLRRVVTLTARTNSIRRGTHLTLHGQIGWNDQNPSQYPIKNPPLSPKWPLHVTVLARRDGKHPFEPIATVLVGPAQISDATLSWVRYGWALNVRPGVTTAYVAKVTGQPPGGQIWANSKTHPFTVQIQH